MQWTVENFQYTNLNTIISPSIGIAYSNCENYPSECTASWGTLLTIGNSNYKNQMLFDYNGQIFVRNQGAGETTFVNWKKYHLHKLFNRITACYINIV